MSIEDLTPEEVIDWCGAWERANLNEEMNKHEAMSIVMGLSLEQTLGILPPLLQRTGTAAIRAAVQQAAPEDLVEHVTAEAFLAGCTFYRGLVELKRQQADDAPG